MKKVSHKNRVLSPDTLRIDFGGRFEGTTIWLQDLERVPIVHTYTENGVVYEKHYTLVLRPHGIHLGDRHA